MRAPSKRKCTDRELDLASAKCLAEFHDCLHEARHGPLSIDRRLGSARHFLVWLRRSGIPLGGIDDAVLRRFRDHDCTCPRHPNGGALYKRRAPRPQESLGHVQQFVRFLETQRTHAASRRDRNRSSAPSGIRGMGRVGRAHAQDGRELLRDGPAPSDLAPQMPDSHEASDFGHP